MYLPQDLAPINTQMRTITTMALSFWLSQSHYYKHCEIFLFFHLRLVRPNHLPMKTVLLKFRNWQMKLIKQKLSLSVIPVLRMSQEILKRRTEETLFEDVVITVAKGFPVCSAAPLPNHVAHPIPSGGKRDPRKWRSQLYMRAHQPFSSSSFQIV